MKSSLTEELVGIAANARVFGKTLTIAVIISHVLFLTCFSCTICLCLHFALPPAASKIRAVELPRRLVQCMHGENVPCPEGYINWILATAVRLVFMFYIPFACLLIYKLWSYTNWFKTRPKKRTLSVCLSRRSVTWTPKTPSKRPTTLSKSPSTVSASRSSPLPPTDKKTLFIGLDGMLVLGTSDVQVLVSDRIGPRILTLTSWEDARDLYVIQRPWVEEFLCEAISSGFEVVIFTAVPKAIAHDIIHWLDPSSKYISHQIYVDASCHETSTQGIVVKDMSVTGRRLDRSVIVDVNLTGQRVCVEQAENAIKLAPFEGDSQDTELLKLSRFFELQRNYNDLRDAVSHYCRTSDHGQSR